MRSRMSVHEEATAPTPEVVKVFTVAPTDN
jgi:hypothetical protein